MAQASGVALLAAYKAAPLAPIVGYTPTQVKQVITSYGRADKKQVQEMVRSILELPSIPRPDDAADGLGLAICHAFSGRIPGAAKAKGA